RSSSTRQVFFSNTKVPVENMLAGRGEGFKIAMNALNVGRIKLAAACLDSQRRVISNATKYSNERKQFNTEISQFGAIRSKLAEKAMKGQIDLLGPAMKVREELFGIPSFDTPDYSALLSEEKEMVSKLKKAFLMVAGGAVQKYGNNLDAHQQLLLAIADVLIEIYM